MLLALIGSPPALAIVSTTVNVATSSFSFRGQEKGERALIEWHTHSQCLKITQNVAFEFWNFAPIFVLLKLTCLITLFGHFWHFNELYVN